jgi:hypothetical protein
MVRLIQTQYLQKSKTTHTQENLLGFRPQERRPSRVKQPLVEVPNVEIRTNVSHVNVDVTWAVGTVNHHKNPALVALVYELFYRKNDARNRCLRAAHRESVKRKISATK